MSKRTHSASPFDPIYLRLANTAVDKKSKIVGVTSPSRGEGSTTVAIGLARSASEADAGPVLLIDAAPRGRRVADQLGVGAKPLGASATCWSNPDEDRLEAYIAHCSNLDIDVLVLDPSQPEIADPGIWHSMLGQLRSRYPFIVVDAADLTTPVPRFWQHRVDELILIVDTTQATIESLARLRKTLNASGIQISGFALNKRRFHVPKFLYRFVY